MRASIRARLLAAFLIVAITAAAGLSFYFLKELEGFALRKLEERLHTQARMLASVASTTYLNGAAEFSATDARKLQVTIADATPYAASRLRVLDADGVAIADSTPGDAGDLYGDRSEVRRALAGEYGAATRMTEEGRVALYVAVPILSNGDVRGVAYASSTTFSIMTLLRDYRLRMALVVALFAAFTLFMTELLSRWLSRPLQDLSVTAKAFAAGDHSVRAHPGGSSETRALAEAFNAMGDEVQRVVTELKEEERRKSRFVSDVSHELRTPLTAIRGGAETLLDGDVPEADARQFLETIIRESDRLTRLANDLLTLQRIEGATGELPLGRIDLRAAADRAIGALAPLTDARGVQVTAEGEAPTVLGDVDRIQQVIANLIDNASRMTGAGGHVRVLLSRDGDHAVLAVLDEGPGIPPEALPHLFERFYRAQISRDRSTGGAGLGLAIVKAIVTAHAGSIEAANRPEGGSAFTLRLPVIGD
ncbi:MAG: ATP-binding protein [Actinomycetota bacterium]|nr:MAG: signal transduction histidine [Actinomycetota bacterium]MDO8950772.1 ATP-binding protein [Actinomycetota bacterium]MDP3630009.1 ATP-binding protein [Actinomycetota bacterium]